MDKSGKDKVEAAIKGIEGWCDMMGIKVVEVIRKKSAKDSFGLPESWYDNATAIALSGKVRSHANLVRIINNFGCYSSALMTSGGDHEGYECWAVWSKT
jgi:hypothetical protein